MRKLLVDSVEAGVGPGLVSEQHSSMLRAVSENLKILALLCTPLFIHRIKLSLQCDRYPFFCAWVSRSNCSENVTNPIEYERQFLI